MINPFATSLGGSPERGDASPAPIDFADFFQAQPVTQPALEPPTPASPQVESVMMYANPFAAPEPAGEQVEPTPTLRFAPLASNIAPPEYHRGDALRKRMENAVQQGLDRLHDALPQLAQRFRRQPAPTPAGETVTAAPKKGIVRETLQRVTGFTEKARIKGREIAPQVDLLASAAAGPLIRAILHATGVDMTTADQIASLAQVGEAGGLMLLNLAELRATAVGNEKRARTLNRLKRMATRAAVATTAFRAWGSLENSQLGHMINDALQSKEPISTPDHIAQTPPTDTPSPVKSPTPHPTDTSPSHTSTMVVGTPDAHGSTPMGEPPTPQPTQEPATTLTPDTHATPPPSDDGHTGGGAGTGNDGNVGGGGEPDTRDGTIDTGDGSGANPPDDTTPPPVTEPQPPLTLAKEATVNVEGLWGAGESLVQNYGIDPESATGHIATDAYKDVMEGAHRVGNVVSLDPNLHHQAAQRMLDTVDQVHQMLPPNVTDENANELLHAWGENGILEVKGLTLGGLRNLTDLAHEILGGG